jgi:hypothetical protein
MKILCFFMILSNLEAFVSAIDAWAQINLGGLLTLIAVVQIILNCVIVCALFAWFCNSDLHKKLVQGLMANLLQTLLAAVLAYFSADEWVASTIEAAEGVKSNPDASPDEKSAAQAVIDAA